MLHVSFWMAERPLLIFAFFFLLTLIWAQFGSIDRKLSDIWFGTLFGQNLSRVTKAIGVSASRKVAKFRRFANKADLFGRGVALFASLSMTALCLLVVFFAAT
jgi:hypothetical protein